MPEITRVEAMDPSQQNSPVTGPIEQESTVLMDAAKKTCVWNGQEFPDGALVCSDGTSYECGFGNWVKRSDPC